jgi:PIN like domain
MNLRAAQVRIFVDADLLGLGKILAGLRNDVTYPGDPGAVIHKRQRAPCPITSPDVLDTDWIPQVAAQGWLILTRDSMIIQNRNEITAVRENNAKMVALNQRDAQTKWGRQARSIHDPVAPHRGPDHRTRPVHLARVAHRDDRDRARLACGRYAHHAYPDSDCADTASLRVNIR